MLPMFKNWITQLPGWNAQLQDLAKALRLIWQASPRLACLWIGLLLVAGLLPAATVAVTRWVVNSLIHGVMLGASWGGVQTILLPAVFMVALMIGVEITNGLLRWVNRCQAAVVADYVAGLVHQQAMAVDMAWYDQPDFHGRLQQVREDANGCPLNLIVGLGGVLQHSLTLVVMAALLLSYGLWLPLLLLVGILPVLMVVFYFGRRYSFWRQKTASDRRWAEYYDTMLTFNQVAAEVRLFNLGSYFASAYQRLRQKLRTEEQRLERNRILARLVAILFALLAAGAGMAWMVWQTLQGLLTLGDLALFYHAFHRGQTLLRSLLGSMGGLYHNSSFINTLFEFLDLAPRVTDPPSPQPLPQPLRQGIYFNNVTFRYPGSEQPVLENFSLIIPAGKTVAIVGDNGAGKSTLIKLLCRFYDPEAGHIDLDGQDLRHFSVQALRCYLTVLFQFPVRYHATAAQNIRLGDLNTPYRAADIIQAARTAGAHERIQRLPLGYNTLLGKAFLDGTDLSGGEWQKVALARAFLRQSSIVILDEPTSAMDPWAESRWLRRFRDIIQGRTTLIITHRFTAAMRADYIYLMQDGRIVESGTHAELLARGGRYAQSWAEQTGTGTPDRVPSRAVLPLLRQRNGGITRPV